MNPDLIRLALRKQRLQIRAAQQRDEVVAGLRRIDALLDHVDGARERVHAVRARIPLVGAAVLVVALVKPRFALRVARRAWLGWLLYRKLGRRFAPLAQLVGRVRGVAARA